MIKPLFAATTLALLIVLLFGRFAAPFPLNLLAWSSLSCVAGAFVGLAKMKQIQNSKKTQQQTT